MIRSRRFFDKQICVCRVCQTMRRKLEIRVAFRPTRLSDEHLRCAYEVLTPVVERVVSECDDEAATECLPSEKLATPRRRKLR